MHEFVRALECSACYGPTTRLLKYLFQCGPHSQFQVAVGVLHGWPATRRPPGAHQAAPGAHQPKARVRRPAGAATRRPQGAHQPNTRVRRPIP